MSTAGRTTSVVCPPRTLMTRVVRRFRSGPRPGSRARSAAISLRAASATIRIAMVGRSHSCPVAIAPSSIIPPFIAVTAPPIFGVNVVAAWTTELELKIRNPLLILVRTFIERYGHVHIPLFEL